MQLTTIDWVVIVLYGLLTVVLGFWFTRRAGQSVEEYFVAGRTLHWETPAHEQAPKAP